MGKANVLKKLGLRLMWTSHVTVWDRMIINLSPMTNDTLNKYKNMIVIWLVENSDDSSEFFTMIHLPRGVSDFFSNLYDVSDDNVDES